MSKESKRKSQTLRSNWLPKYKSFEGKLVKPVIRGRELYERRVVFIGTNTVGHKVATFDDRSIYYLDSFDEVVLIELE